jgi:hypothetical protein
MGDGNIVGTWSLISWELRDGDGRVSYPMGKNPVGRLMYSSDGHVSVLITGHGRHKVIPGDAALGVPDARITVARRSLSYAGSYERCGEKITHRVELSTFPGWVGTNQERFISWQGDCLVLTALPTSVGGKEQSAVLVWERAENIS